MSSEIDTFNADEIISHMMASSAATPVSEYVKDPHKAMENAEKAAQEWLPDKYTVICDERNNSEEDIANGRLNVTIIPPAPKFIEIKINSMGKEVV